MSEYQYYEFRAIDRSLTDRQMRELRAISTRAAISRTSFSNYYTFGDLKANPRDLLMKYFDASLYFANWVFLEVAFRYPKGAVNVKAIRRYAMGHTLEIRSTARDVVVAISIESDGESFDTADDGSNWLSSLIGLRADLASGDERVLYLAWLLDVQCGEIDDDTFEPARPDGLGNLSPALDSLVDVIGLDRDLVIAAAEGAPAAARSSTRDVDRWIAALDGHDKVSLLSRVARGETGVGAELMRRFPGQATRREPIQGLRTAGALRARAAELADQRRARIVARETKERARREREQAAARDRHLNRLATRRADAWRRVETLIATKRPGDYDTAVTLLKDLREVGERKGRSVEIAERIRALRDAHAKKPSLLARLRRAGLLQS